MYRTAAPLTGLGNFTKFPCTMSEPDNVWLAPRAEIFKALGHPTRLYIVQELRAEPRCVSDLTSLVGADTSTVSKHLSVLKNAGVVYATREGSTVYYRLACNCLGQMVDAANVIVRQRAERAASADRAV